MKRIGIGKPALIATALAPLIFMLFRLTMPSDDTISLLFDTRHWPGIFERLWILDIGMCWFLTLLGAHAFLTILAMNKLPPGSFPRRRTIPLIAHATSTVGGVIATTRGSWYTGVETYLSSLVVCILTLVVVLAIANRFRRKDSSSRPAARRNTMALPPAPDTSGHPIPSQKPRSD